MNEYHPKTVIFFGAGSTCGLCGATSDIARFFSEMTNNGCIEQRIHSYFGDRILPHHKSVLADLFQILGDSINDESLKEKIIDRKANQYAVEFSGDAAKIKKSLYEMASRYDWSTFKKICHKLKNKNGDISLQSLYTAFDLLIDKEQGLLLENEYTANFLNILKAQKLIKVFTIILHFIQLSYISEKEKNKFDPYYEFADAVTELMRKESIELDQCGIEYTDKEFYLYSHANISFNWDTCLLGILFNANKKFNHGNNVPYLGKHCRKLRLFNDMGIAVGSIRKDGEKERRKIWYQGHESVAIRINDADYPNDRLMRVGKLLYPHGSYLFRICPICKRTNMVVRSIGEDLLPYFGNMILPEFQNFYKSKRLTEKEETAVKSGIFDAIECYQCGAMMGIDDAPMVIQSLVKTRKPSLLEEATHEMIHLVDKAKHIVFIGYSIPDDDALYRVMLSLAINDKPDIRISIINHDNRLSKGNLWYHKNCSNDLEKMKQNDTARRFIELFSYCEHLRISFAGFPDILNRYNNTFSAVEDIYYWDI